MVDLSAARPPARAARPGRPTAQEPRLSQPLQLRASFSPPHHRRAALFVVGAPPRSEALAWRTAVFPVVLLACQFWGTLIFLCARLSTADADADADADGADDNDAARGDDGGGGGGAEHVSWCEQTWIFTASLVMTSLQGWFHAIAFLSPQVRYSWRAWWADLLRRRGCRGGGGRGDGDEDGELGGNDNGNGALGDAGDGHRGSGRGGSGIYTGTNANLGSRGSSSVVGGSYDEYQFHAADSSGGADYAQLQEEEDAACAPAVPRTRAVNDA